MSEAPKVHPEDWEQWVSSPITKAFINYLTEVRAQSVDVLLNLQADSSEQLALDYLGQRYFINAIDQVKDLDHIKLVLVGDIDENA